MRLLLLGLRYRAELNDALHLSVSRLLA